MRQNAHISACALSIAVNNLYIVLSNREDFATLFINYNRTYIYVNLLQFDETISPSLVFMYIPTYVLIYIYESVITTGLPVCFLQIVKENLFQTLSQESCLERS